MRSVGRGLARRKVTWKQPCARHFSRSRSSGTAAGRGRRYTALQSREQYGTRSDVDDAFAREAFARGTVNPLIGSGRGTGARFGNASACGLAEEERPHHLNIKPAS